MVSQYAVGKWSSTKPVGSLQPTGSGLFDLAGNVSEWVATDWGFADARTPWLVKGGAFSDAQFKPLSSDQTTSYGTTRSVSIGFRIVKVGDK